MRGHKALLFSERDISQGKYRLLFTAADAIIDSRKQRLAALLHMPVLFCAYSPYWITSFHEAHEIFYGKYFMHVHASSSQAFPSLDGLGTRLGTLERCFCVRVR